MRKTADGRPVLILLFDRGSRASHPKDMFQWVAHVRKVAGKKGIPFLSTTPKEHVFLTMLLNANARRLSGKYQPERQKFEDRFTLSFLVPLAPLSFPAIERLYSPKGCFVCGALKVTYCSQCKVVEYCGQGEVCLCSCDENLTAFDRLPKDSLERTQGILCDSSQGQLVHCHNFIGRRRASRGWSQPD